MRKTNASDRAYEAIYRQILNFDLHPGQVVSDYLISKNLDMSRTPIREALHKLEMDGLVEKMENGNASYRIAPITVEEIQDLFDFREGLESTAFRLAWQRGISAEETQGLQDLVDEMFVAQQEGKVKKHLSDDQKFHNALVGLSQNKRLLDAHAKLLIQLSRMRFLTFWNPELQKKASFEHQEIVDAIRKGDGEGGLDAIVRHIRTSCTDFKEILEDGIPTNLIHLLQVFSKSDDE